MNYIVIERFETLGNVDQQLFSDLKRAERYADILRMDIVDRVMRTPVSAPIRGCAAELEAWADAREMTPAASSYYSKRAADYISGLSVYIEDVECYD